MRISHSVTYKVDPSPELKKGDFQPSSVFYLPTEATLLQWRATHHPQRHWNTEFFDICYHVKDNWQVFEKPWPSNMHRTNDVSTIHASDSDFYNDRILFLTLTNTPNQLSSLFPTHYIQHLFSTLFLNLSANTRSMETTNIVWYNLSTMTKQH